MALNWDGREMDPATLSGEEWPVTETLILLTMAVGMGTITEDNAETFAMRVAALEAVSGTSMRRYPEGGQPVDVPITYAMVRARTGLKTNASSLTNAAFRKRIADMVMGDAAAQVSKQRTEWLKAGTEGNGDVVHER